MIFDLFPGPGGWDEGVRAAGYTGPLLGLEIDPDAVATARAAGHDRDVVDLATVDPFYDRVHLVLDGLIGSPPCPSFSPGGLHRGEADPRGALVRVPVRWALRLRPRWVALEQVPTVLPIWEEEAAKLREAGYDVEARIVNARTAGVAQDRSRAVLLARRDGLPIRWPDPVEARGMADVLPWSPFDRVGFARRADRPSNKAGNNVVEIDGQLYRARDLRLASRPAQTLTEKARSWRRYPAGGGESVRVTIEEASILQGFRPDYPWQGSRTSQFRQCSNAVPPPLAAALLADLVGEQRATTAA